MTRALNDNEVSSFKSYNVNDNEARGMRKVLNTERIAKDLVKAFNSPGSWKRYCELAGTLPENVIRTNVEIALERAKTNPGGYFNRLCQISIYKLNK